MTAVVVILCLVFLPFILSGPYYTHILILTMMNVVLASSLRVINLSGQMSLAHGGMMTVGAYASALLVMKGGFSFWIAMPVSALFVALVASAIGYPFVRLKGIYFSIVTIFFSEVVVLTAQQWQGLTGGSAGIFAIPRPNAVFALDFASKIDFYYLMLVLMVICLSILYAVERSRVGMILRAVRQADSLSESVGIDTTGYKVLAFAIGSFFAGLMGAFYSHYISAINPDAFSFLFTVYILIYMTVGGEKRFVGPILGAFVLTVLPEVARPLKAFMPFLYAAVLITVIFFVPEGMVGLPKLIRRKNVAKGSAHA